MRSLFTRILLWFLATLAITVIGFVAITAFSTAARGGGHLAARATAFQLEEARHAFETGGRDGLAAYLERFNRVFRARAALTDAAGRDLATGEDRSELVARARRRFSGLLLHRAGVIVARPSDDGQYWFFLFIPRARAGDAFLLPQHLWIVAAVVLLCYGLARHLTSPLRQLRTAVERLGRGDFSARVNSRRRDELGELARTFDDMAGRIETLVTAERRLLQDISHELRSPLSRLAVAVELARSGEDREAALNRIQTEADRLNALVGELLQVTRAEGDPATLRAAPVRLDEVLSALAADCALEAQARGCRVEFRSAGPVTVQGDAELLRRAVENVLRNAIRHAPEASAVELTLEGNASARVRVRDYGPGVPAEHLSRIFEPFYRVEPDRDRASGGAGLGLAIARRAVQLHRGRIEARNAQPGLLVEIELPLGPQR